MSAQDSEAVELPNTHLCENTDILDCLSHFPSFHFPYTAENSLQAVSKMDKVLALIKFENKQVNI